MTPAAVYLQERLQGESTHDSRVALVLADLGLDVHAVTRECVVPWRSVPVWEESSRQAVLRRIARLKPSVLFCEGGAWHLLGIPFARHTWVRSPTRSNSMVKDRIQTALLRRADAVSICNPWERARWSGFHLVNLPYPLDTQFWSAPVSRDEDLWVRLGLEMPSGPVIVSVGQIITRKRPVETFRALAPLLIERSDVSLLFVGETFEPAVEEQLRAAIEAERLEKQVCLLGVVRPREELRQLLAWTDVHVLNTTWESQCMALYESLAAGVPTLIPSLPELTSAFPNLPSHASAEEMRRNVTAVLDDPAFGRELIASSEPHLRWADNESHDRLVREVVSSWLSCDEGGGATGRSAARGRDR